MRTKVSSNEEVARAQYATAMDSPEKLLRFLQETGRSYLVLDTTDLVKALPWPGGVQALQEILTAYRNYRASQPTGEEAIERVKTPNGKAVSVIVPQYKGEQLDETEFEAAMEYMRQNCAAALQEKTDRQRESTIVADQLGTPLTAEQFEKLYLRKA